MMKNNCILRLLALLFVSALLMATVSLAAEAGSAEDPLVTLSYLNETFLDTVLQRVDQRLAGYSGGTVTVSPGVSSGNTAASAFTVVTLTQGQTLTGGIGCELLLRAGNASCVAASSPGLIDETSGDILEHGGALSQNHLYMMTIEDRGILAASPTVKVMVRGGYTIA